MPIKHKLKPEPRPLYLNGLSPQQAIRKLQDMITHTPEPYKAYLRIEEYHEGYGNPFNDFNADKSLRLVCYKKD